MVRDSMPSELALADNHQRLAKMTRAIQSLGLYIQNGVMETCGGAATIPAPVYLQIADELARDKLKRESFLLLLNEAVAETTGVGSNNA